MAIIVPITVFLVIIWSSTVMGGMGCDAAAAARKQ
jgi:hypothetical protein